MLGLGSSLLQGGALRSIVRSGLQLFYKADRTQAPLGEEQIRNNSFDEISGNLVLNPTFDLGSEEIQNRFFDELGPDKIDNGNFETGIDGWIAVAGSNVTYNSVLKGIKLKKVGTTACRAQNEHSDTVQGETYKLTYRVLENNNCTAITVWNGTSYEGSTVLNVEANGEDFVYYLKFEGGNSPDLYFKNNTDDSDITLSNIKLEKVDPNDRWETGTGWSIEEGKAVCDGFQGGNTGLTQSLSSADLVSGKTYKLSYTISNYVSGDVNPHLRGNYVEGQRGIGDGDKVVYIEAGSSASYAVSLFASSTFNAEISNVSVKEVPNWVLRNDTTIVDGVANVIAAGNIGGLNGFWSLESLANVFEPSKSYEIKFRARQVSSVSGNAGAFQVGNSYGALFDEVITSEFVDYTFIAQTSSTGNWPKLTIGGRTAGDVFQVDNISVKQLDPSSRWEAGAGWVFNDNGTITHTGSTGNFESSQELVTGKKYEATVIVDSIADGSCNLFNSSNSETYDNTITETGTHVRRFTATHATSKIALRSASSNLVVSSFSVKEITNSIKDHSKNSNDGILYSGKALALDPDTSALDYVNLKPSDEIGITSAGFTFAIWFKADSTQPNGPDDRIFSSRRNSGSSYFSIGLGDNGYLRIHLRESSSSLPATFVQTNYRDDKWHRVIVAATPTAQYIYVDNELVGTATSTLGGTPSSDSARLGTSPAAGVDNSLKCNLADLQIYDKAWNATDVKYDWENPDKDVFDRVGEAQVLGEEEVVDGNFPLPNVNWDLLNGATISNNKANIIGDGSAFTSIKQAGVFENGKVYEVVIDVTITSGLGLKFQDGANNENIGFATTTGVYTFNFTGTSNADLVVGRRTSGTAFDSSVNNISVREVTTHASHILPTDCKSLLRLNEGAGDRVYDAAPILGEDQMESRNGSFELGEELNDLTWIGFGGWSIDGDIASNDGGGSTITNDILELGKTYQFKCKLSSYTSGEFSLFLGNGNESSRFSGTDEFTFTGVCAGDLYARVKSINGIGSLSISSLTIKEVPNWSHVEDVELDDSGVFFNNGDDNIFQNFSYIDGATYAIGFEGTSDTGLIRYRTGFEIDSISNPKLETPIPGTAIWRPDSSSQRIQLWGPSSGTATVSKVTIKEIKPAESFAIVGDKNFVHQQPYIPQYAMSSFSKKMVFDGNNDYVTGSFNGNIGPAKDITFSCWFNYEDSVAAASDRETLFGLLASAVDGDPYEKLEVGIFETNRVVVYTGDGTNYNQTASGANSLSNNKLNHVAASLSSNGALKVYINGVESATATHTNYGATTITHYRIGSRKTSGSSPLSNKGIIDELSLFKTVLTQDEVLELYNSGSSFDSTGHSKYNLGEEVSNGTFELGSEEVVDGDFPTGTTAWIENDWTISNNIASSGNTSSLLRQNNVFTNSTGIYKSTFKARSVNGTSVTLRFYDGVNFYETFTITSSDFQDFTLTRQRAGESSDLYIYNISNAEIEISNVSVKEIPSWSSSTASSATISVNTSGQLELASNTGDKLGAYTAISLVQGRTYVLSVDVISCDVLGQVRIGTSASVGSTSPNDIFNAGGSGVPLGTNTYTFTATSAQASNGFLYIGGREDVNSLVIDNVSLQEYGLSAYWRNNGADQWDDLSINSNHGTVSGSPTEIFLQEVPFFGKDSLGMFMNKPRLGGLNFNGSGYVANQGMPTISDNISFSFWIKLEDFVTGNIAQVVGKRTSGDSNWCRVYRPSANSLRLEVAAADQLDFTIEEAEWAHVAITIDGRVAKAYVNGALTAQGTLSGDFEFLSANDFSVGSWKNTATSISIDSLLNGVVDDVMVYDETLTLKQVTKNYNATKGKHKN